MCLAVSASTHFHALVVTCLSGILAGEMRNRLAYITCILSVMSLAEAFSQDASGPFQENIHSAWVDSVFNTLSPDERIAQLIMVAVRSGGGEEHHQPILQVIRERKIGGLVFFEGGPGRLAALVNEYQQVSDVPLLISLEAGLESGMQLDSAIRYPCPLTLGAVRNGELIYRMGRQIGQQLKRVGVYVNLASIEDSSPTSHIDCYSLGGNKENIANKLAAYRKGLEDERVLLVEWSDSLQQLPFRQTTLSSVGGVAAIEDVPGVIAAIRNDVREGRISQRVIDEQCRKVLALKQWTGLDRIGPVPVAGIADDLNKPQYRLLKKKMVEHSLTVLRNENELLPLRSLDTLRMASIAFGAEGITAFQRMLNLYGDVRQFALPLDASLTRIDSLKNLLTNYNLVLGSLHGKSFGPLGVSQAMADFIDWLTDQNGFVLAVFGNPAEVGEIKGLEKVPALIMAYQDDLLVEELAAQLIFGGISADGRLPVSIGQAFPAGSGVDVQGGIRFAYTLPEEVGMDSRTLNRGIDSLVAQALDVKAIPGCQVLVARDRKVVFHKAYGWHSYSDTVRVKPDDLYDLASVTKISTSMAALMKLFDEGKFELGATLGDYLPDFRRSNKAGIPMYDLLTHQGRLVPFIPFYLQMYRKNGHFKWATVKVDSSRRFPIRLTDRMYLHRKYPEKMVKGIRKSPLRDEKQYVYSDFFFMLAPRIVETMVDGRFQEYLQENFYSRLGATTLTFNPYRKYPRSRIVPTEDDFVFRRQTVHGTVHDENAAMMNGISGHAGLFANANDLAKLMQMYLDMGTYGGERFIAEATLRMFSRTQFPENNNRRALGFDKPNLNYIGVNNNTAKDAGPNSFGHTGFTGTFAWVDPDTGLLYIFLSNRVSPTRANTRLYQLNTRTQIQQAMYDAIKAGGLLLDPAEFHGLR